MIDPFGAKEKRRVEAAAWVVRMDAGASDYDRLEFQKWLAKDSAHQADYDQAMDTYRGAILIRHSPIGQDRSLEMHFPGRPRFITSRVLAASLAALLLIAGYELGTGTIPFMGPPLQAAMLSSGPTARNVQLNDGSWVRLEPATTLRIDLTRTTRRAQLRNGRARLTVAHDSRPFVLEAGAEQSSVHEGQFELLMVEDRGAIRAIQPGQSGLSAQVSQGPASQAGTDASNSLAVLEFTATPLAEVARQANQASSHPILQIDPALSSLPVTGVFSAGDSVRLARSLAAAFDLALITDLPGIVRLEPRPK